MTIYLEFGKGNIFNIEDPNSNGSLLFNVPYPEGDYDFNDVLYVRVKTANGLWSQTTILDLIDPDLAVDKLANNTIAIFS